jgi:hypothetical protein
MKVELQRVKHAMSGWVNNVTEDDDVKNSHDNGKEVEQLDPSTVI